MAKFFKYKSIADLEAENQRLDIDLRFSDDLSSLEQPIVIDGRCVGNRWAIHPMEGCDGELDGRPGELTLRRYRRFGDGGAKLIWGEACAVNLNARANPRQIVLNEETKGTFVELVQGCRQAHREANGDDTDLLIGLQLTHSGRYASPLPLIATHDPLLVGRYKVDDTTPTLSDSALSAMIDDYVQAAKLAAEVGFDFVDVKQCHRYLLGELLGARNRDGRYGGSYENRTRLATEIFTAIRQEVPSLILATRMNAYDGIPFTNLGEPEPWTAPLANGWGMSIDDPFQPDMTEPIRWIGDMKQLGVSIVNVAMGNPYAQPHFGRPFETPPPDGYESPEHPLIGVDRHFRLAAELQQAHLDLPMIGTGYSYLQEFLPQAGAANIRDGRITFVGLGRASLSQPDMPRLLRETGSLDRKRVCRTFSYCTAMMRAKDHPMGQFPAGCPPFDKEAYNAIWKEVQQLQLRKSETT